MHDDRRLVPFGYGDEYLERLDATGGLSASVVDVARLIASFSVRTGNPVLAAPALNQMFTMARDRFVASAGFADRRAGHGFDAVTDLGGGRFHGDKGGSLGTSGNAAWFDTDDFGYVMCWGNQPTEGAWYPFNTMLAAARAHAWGATDLFPRYSMPAF